MFSQEQQEQLASDIDLRLMWIWQLIMEYEGEPTLAVWSSWIRAAYGKGYIDALVESPRGKLCSDNGFRIPERVD